MSKALTNKQKMFCLEYLKDLNATQAAIRAGYSENTAEVIGYENLRKPYIQEEIQKQMNKRAEKAEISAESILNDILEVKDRCMQKKPVLIRDGKEWVQQKEYVEHEDGTETEEGVWKFDAGGALKALELVGKHLKLFTDKVETEVKGEMKINFNIPRPKNKK